MLSINKFNSELSKPIILSVTGYKIITEKIAVAINPLYKAFITFFEFPNLTKNVPIIEVIIQAPPIVKA